MNVEQPISNYNGSPQIEDGYTRIANELLEAIALFDFSSRELKIIMVLARMSFGYGKKSDCISGWQFSKMTNIDKAHISRSIKKLVEMNVIIRHETGRKSHGIFVNDLSINKYYDTWKTVADSATVAERAPLLKKQLTVAERATQPLLKEQPHKERNKQKKYICESVHFERFWNSYPTTRRVAKKTCNEKWKNKKLDDIAEIIIMDVLSKKQSWGKFNPSPLTYINQERWNDGCDSNDDIFAGAI